jgi:HSP20 family molecular chaperone IbpA
MRMFDLIRWSNSFNSDYWTALNPVQTTHTNEGSEIAISAPGVDAEKIEVILEDGLLSVSFNNPHGKKFGYSEVFKKVWSVSKEVTEKDLTAKYDSGILTVFVANREKPKQRIKIKVA